jgi:outer membrane protein TolC
LRIARNGLRAQFDLDAGYRVFGESDPSFLGQQVDQESWNVGLNLALPLQQVAERNAWRSAQIGHQQALRNFDEFEDSLKVDVHASFRALERLRHSLEIQRELIGDEERGLRIAQIRFEAGEIPNRDFVEARQSLLAAQNSLISEQVSYEIQRLRLLRDLGILFIDGHGMFKE